MKNMRSYEEWKKYGSETNSVSVTWNQKDLEDLEWEATYQVDEIPPEDVWDTFATKNKKEMEEMYKDWGAPKEGSLHYMCIRPKLNESLSSLLDPYSDKKFNYNFLKLTQGCSLLWHYDTYATFVRFNDIPEEKIDQVCRTVVMTSDWDRGQMLQIGDAVYTHWKAGTTYTWKGDTWHGMANFGPNECVVSQITFLDEEGAYDNLWQ